MDLARSTALVAVIAEVMQWAGGLGAIYFTVALVTTLAQAHVGAIAGRTGVLVELYERAIPIIVCLAVVASAAALGDAVGRWMTSGVQDATGAVALWRGLAEIVVQAVLMTVGASLAVGFASGVLGAQLSLLGGQPGILSALAARLMLVVLTGVLTLLAVRLAGLVIGLV
ncbi:MAG: hypothetical protein IT318_21850 [Anaerolineales bacterium]|nr:hypothetical protein [Anaerolineales bacterium]